MKFFLAVIVLTVTCLLLAIPVVYAQIEPVQSDHPVYDFLSRMEVKHILPQYHGTVTPIPRQKISGYLSTVHQERERLTRTERQMLDSYRIEFSFDLGYDTKNDTHFFDGNGVPGYFGGFPNHRQRYLYAYHDTTGTSLFFNGFVSVEHRTRSVSGDYDGSENYGLTVADFGGTVRGTIYNRLGYMVEVRNAYGGGDRELASEIGRLWHSRDYRTAWEDFAEFSRASVRYQAGIIGIELSRDRLQWRESYGESLFLSGNAPMFNALKIDLSYKSVNYIYVHGAVLWHNYRQMENQKYFVANRFEFSVVRNRFSIGINQSTMYSRSSPEIGYLIPFNVLEATERNVGDRDASMIGFDITVRPVRNLEMKSGAYFDDIRLDESFTTSRRNMWSVHAGIYYADIFGWRDTDLKVNYTRIEPHVYAHEREPYLHYEHDGFLLGHSLGPNSDEWLAALEYRPSWQWRLKLEFLRQRHGANPVDEQGTVIRNVGGDVFFPHRRDIDPETKKFLDGLLFERNIMRTQVQYEVFRQFILGIRAEWAEISFDDRSWQQLTMSAGVWVVL
jgi:hypothetical protein